MLGTLPRSPRQLQPLAVPPTQSRTVARDPQHKPAVAAQSELISCSCASTNGDRCLVLRKAINLGVGGSILQWQGLPAASDNLMARPGIPAHLTPLAALSLLRNPKSLHWEGRASAS